LRRLAADQPQLRAVFQTDADLGPVTALSPSLSDPHHGGRVAIALTFASGLKLVYKPRNLGLEEGYFQLLAWLNERGMPLSFKVLKVLNRETYGWVEYIMSTPCQNKAAAARYYRRSGMLLTLLYALEATDCHLDNLIAAGDQPVLVDAETLMHPRARRAGAETGALALARQQILNSVLRTAMLPSWRIEPQGQTAYDTSGLGAAGEQELRQQVAWRHLNTDYMAVSYEADKIRSFTNAPFQESDNWSPADYIDEVLAGFEQMYHFLRQHQADLAAPLGPLSGLARQSSRFLLRDTRGYYAVVEKSLNPKFLRDGAEWDIQLDLLSRWVLAMNDEQVVYRSLLPTERQTLARLDIPYFATRPDSDALFLSPNQAVPHFFSRPSYENTLIHLQQLDDHDLARQLEFIRATYCARYLNPAHLSATSSQETAVEGVKLTAFQKFRDKLPDPRDATQNPWNLLPKTVSANLVQSAIEIATVLRQRAICSVDGCEAAWLGLNYLAEVDRFQFQPLPSDLYSGNSGIALFLAALEKITGGAGFRDLALAAAQPIRLFLTELQTASPAPKSISLGGGVGLGGMIYALTRVGQWLDEAAPLAEARQATALITPEVIAADDKLDVMIGTAGAILNLLTLYRATGDPAILDRAAACGQHLLNKRVTTETGSPTWPNQSPTGFAHSPDGMTYALLQLYQVMQENQKVEKSSFLIPQPSAPSPQPSPGWCCGAAGMGLARLGGLAVQDTPDIRQEIDLALQMALEAGLEGEDHLCCGNFGRLELLVVAAQRLSRPELLETARQQAAWLVNRAGENGGFHLFSGPGGNVYHPGFFRGTAGIGYQLLRLANPDTLPSVLLWE
jgi:type 2 lantibiotic biosynthesis protein LanM